MAAEQIGFTPPPRVQGAGPGLRTWAAGACLLPTVGFATAWVLLWPDFVASGYAESFYLAAIATLIGLLVQAAVLNRMLGKLRALTLVGEALASWAHGEPDPPLLKITADESPDARHWNRLVQQLEDDRCARLSGEVEGPLAADAADTAQRDGTLDGLPHGVLVLGPGGSIRLANGAACRMLARSRERLVGARLDRVADDQNLLGVVDRVGSGRDARGGVVELNFGDETEQTAIVRATIRPVGPADRRRALVVLEDVTQQRTADQSRNLFVAQATHELRTPLTNIGLYLERAIDLEEDEVAERSECLNVINAEVLRLGRVVEEVLSVSQIEAGSMKIGRDDVRLDHLMESLEQEYRPQARSKQLSLGFQLPPKLPTFQGDRNKLGLALHNLIGNALKYTPPGGSVRVQVDYDDRELVVAVSDTGIGIPEADLPRVFDKFHRADDPRLAEIKGTGLGLALAREVIRLHGGDIDVESTLDQGSTFTLRLPLRAGKTTEAV